MQQSADLYFSTELDTEDPTLHTHPPSPAWSGNWWLSGHRAQSQPQPSPRVLSEEMFQQTPVLQTGRGIGRVLRQKRFGVHPIHLLLWNQIIIFILNWAFQSAFAVISRSPGRQENRQDTDRDRLLEITGLTNEGLNNTPFPILFLMLMSMAVTQTQDHLLDFSKRI